MRPNMRLRRASTSVPLAKSFPANHAVVTTILEMAVTDDTRSDFEWIRLQNGDLILGIFPRGDGYFEVETEVEFDYKRAAHDGNVITIPFDRQNGSMNSGNYG